MVNSQPTPFDPALDSIFAALSHVARRQALDQLGVGPKSVSDLAAPHDMSLVGFMKHVRTLEAAGLIECNKRGRTVTCSLAPHPLRSATEWLGSRERLWTHRLDALERHLQAGESKTGKRKTGR